MPRTSADGARGQSVYFRDPDANLLELLCTEGQPVTEGEPLVRLSA